jgi:hypothetical protein
MRHINRVRLFDKIVSLERYRQRAIDFCSFGKRSDVPQTDIKMYRRRILFTTQNRESLRYEDFNGNE